MTITFVGHGYVGLVTACVFADFGNTVWVIGHTKEKLDRLKEGDPIIYEPGLQEMLQKNIKAGRIKFTQEYEEAVAESEVVFIAVGTPPKETGEADLSAVLHVAENIAKNLTKKFTVVSCKSTVPVGTNTKVRELIERVKPEGAEFAVASCPEFLREGVAINDTVHPDRVVIGSYSQQAIDVLVKLHKAITDKMVITDLASAELIKYTANAMLATKISFANMISFYCEQAGADVEKVLDAVGLDRRIGRIFFSPGVGYGGSCFPKDVKALIQIGKNYNVDTTLLDAVEKVNKQARENLINKVKKHVIQGSHIGIWGVSFKPNTDDIREAPAIHVMKALLKEGYTITLYDPIAMDNAKGILGDTITYADNLYDVANKAEALCILTEWNEFKQADIAKVGEGMTTKRIIDGRNIYDPEMMKKLGFTYISTGRAE